MSASVRLREKIFVLLSFFRSSGYTAIIPRICAAPPMVVNSV